MNGGTFRVLPALALTVLIGVPAFSQPGKPLAVVSQPGKPAPAVAQPDKPLVSLGRLEPGLWEVRILNSKQAARNICVSDPAALIQLQHPQLACSRFVIANDAQGVTIHYTCPANDYGRTSVRVETARLAKIDTQGILNNAPFAYRAEAKRIGSCDSKASAAR